MFSIRTSKPSSRSIPRTIAAPCSGSWPCHPPQAISAARIVRRPSASSSSPRRSAAAAAPAARGGSRSRRPGPPRTSAPNASITSSTCRASVAAARCGRSSRMARAMSATPDDAVVVVGVAAWSIGTPPSRRRASRADLAAEPVGVGHDQRALGAVDLHRQVAVRQTSKLRRRSTTAPETNSQRRRGMGRHLDRDRRARRGSLATVRSRPARDAIAATPRPGRAG